MKIKIYRVTGCGITVIGPDDASMRWIISQMIERGGFPEVQEITEVA